jgi:hypothetical protein
MKDIRGMPAKHAEIAAKYGDSRPTVYRSLSSSLVSQNLSLCAQALGVVERIERSWYGKGTVLDTEFDSIGHAFKANYENEKALKMYREAHKRARDPEMAAGTLKSIASIYIYVLW